MSILTGQAEAHQQHRRVENALKVADHWNRATLAGDHRLAGERRRERAAGGVEQGAVEAGAPRTAAVQVR